MKLTSEQEMEIIDQYKRKIWQMVGLFGNANNCEDLFHEAVIEFLLHIRKANTFRELHRFPTEMIRNALCRYVLRQQAVSFPQRTTDFAQKVRMSKEVGLETLNNCVGSTDDDWARQIDIRDYLKSLPADTFDMIEARGAGEDNNSIAKRHHMTPSGVTRRIQRAAKYYYDNIA